MTEGTKKPQPESSDLKARLGIKSLTTPPGGSSRESTASAPVEPDPFATQPGMGGTGWQPPVPGKPESHVPDVSSSRRWIWVGLSVVGVAAFGVGMVFGNVFDQRSRRQESIQQAKQLLQEIEVQDKQIAVVDKLVTTVKQHLGNPDAAAVKDTKEFLTQLSKYNWEKLDDSKNDVFTRITQTDFGSPLVRSFVDYHVALLTWQQLVKEFASYMDDNKVDSLAQRSVLLKNGINRYVQVENKKSAEKFGLMLTNMGISSGNATKFPQGTLVEIAGDIACKENRKSKSTPCTLEDVEVPFRTEVGGKIEKRPMVFQEGGIVSLVPNVFLSQMIVGSPHQLTYDRYKYFENQLILSLANLRQYQHRLQYKLEERSNPSKNEK